MITSGSLDNPLCLLELTNFNLSIDHEDLVDDGLILHLDIIVCLVNDRLKKVKQAGHEFCVNDFVPTHAVESYYHPRHIFFW